MRARRAITLIEMIFVVVILATLLAVALPRMAGTGDRTALTTTGRDIVRMATMARQAAVSMQAETRLVFSMKDRSWKLELPPAEERRRGRGARERSSTWEQTNKLHARVRFEEFLRDGSTVRGEELTVRFLPNGTSTGATIVLANTRDRRLTVDIERATGRSIAYSGEPMEFADLVAMAGGDPTKFAGVEPSKMNLMPTDGEDAPRFYSIERSREERISAYGDAASRIMGRVTREHERQQQQSGAPEARTQEQAPAIQREATTGGGRRR